MPDFSALYATIQSWAADTAEREKASILPTLNMAERWALNHAWGSILRMLPNLVRSAVDSALGYFEKLSTAELVSMLVAAIESKKRGQIPQAESYRSTYRMPPRGLTLAEWCKRNPELANVMGAEDFGLVDAA